MSVTNIYADGKGHISVNGQTMTIQQYMAMGGAGTGAAQQPSQSVIDGKQMLQDFLTEYGLSGININDAWSQYVKSGSNIDYWTNTWLPTTTAFQTEYPAYEQLMQEGRGLTVADYRNYQLTVQAEAHQAGFPDGVVDSDTVTQWLLAGVNAPEAQQRIIGASTAINQLDKNSQEYLQARELGLTDGDLAAVWFDPDKALPALQTKLAAAQIGGAALDQGMSLGTSTAEDLAKRGVTAQQAQQGFGQLAQSQQLLTALPGQQGPTLNQQQAVGAEFGTNANAAQQLKQRAAQRQAAFQGGGSPTSTSAGFVGAGASRGV